MSILKHKHEKKRSIVTPLNNQYYPMYSS